MKLNLDFTLYQGKTRLKRWWREVKAHFEAVQMAHNALEDAHAADKTALEAADSILSTRIEQEKTTRASEVQSLSQRISKETLDRQAADNSLSTRVGQEETTRAGEVQELSQRILKETADRAEADNAFDERLNPVEEKAHIHENEEVLDGITADDVEKWNGIKEQVTQKQLDEAIAYFEEIGFSLSAQFAMLMNALGIVTYDGGWFGEEQDGVSLDGGAFDDMGLSLFDCGGFEPITVNTDGGIAAGAVIDGGNY